MGGGGKKESRKNLLQPKCGRGKAGGLLVEVSVSADTLFPGRSTGLHASAIDAANQQSRSKPAAVRMCAVKVAVPQADFFQRSTDIDSPAQVRAITSLAIGRDRKGVYLEEIML